MPDKNEPSTRTDVEYIWAFGGKIPKSQLALDSDPPPGSQGDQFDDDYWRWSFYRKPRLTGWLGIEELSKRLQAEADDEYAERQRQRPVAEIAADNLVQPTYFDTDSRTGLRDAFWTTVDGHWSIIALMLPIFVELSPKRIGDESFGQFFTEVNRISAEAQAKVDDDLRQRVGTALIQ